MWDAGDAYDRCVGRWSRLVAKEFVDWLDVPAGQDWLDVGCGTGALTNAAGATHPKSIIGVDQSEKFLQRPGTAVGDAQELPLPANHFDVVVSGLTLNFVPDPTRATSEFTRVVRPGGVVAAYVWDYAEGMQMMRHFWDAATELDPNAPDEGTKFPLCQPENLASLWADAGLDDITTTGIEVPTAFADFDDYWQPFLGATGPAPAYLAKLPEQQQQELRELVRKSLPEPINLTARAWAVSGYSPA